MTDDPTTRTAAPVTSTTSLPVLPTGRTAEALWRRTLSGSWVPITVATVALFLLSPIVAPGSLAPAPLLSMLPFASVLAIAAAGQTLVVQQRGLDLSVPGMIALAAVLATALPQQYGWDVWPAVVVAVVLPGVFGLVSGGIVVGLRIMPLVATLGMNAILLGTVFAIANGTPSGAADQLNQFALNRTLGIPNTLLIALVVIAIAAVVTHRSIIGRRLTAVGVSEPAAAVVGIRFRMYQILAYGFAGLFYGAAGVLLAGYTKTPPLFLGDQYLLPTVAAVVLGGAALTGGISSIAATAVAALFLTQLGQLLRSVGWPDALQLIAQAVVLIAVVLLREYVPALLRRRAVRKLRAA
ncbi:MAG: ABC transporter permease [Microbacterium sp.]|uniref:ABC transporter permease n=1 Tax=Microbacterium sp. TaxID=51671 RepID=UPI001AC14C58|nr:ABC transporter permease [Microbacterium sp.]MBN9154931.1 ABC transporter permease [Microbacterium sp.]MBN9174302.1 ABC transporter permease [Microbacterium sp.]MBN9184620.1 ABC transporter permease [Microbacterium sp.]MBN9190247.1 ABC transporter permease [Microbacterium sp.]MBN9193040.1 ABC transporter permease [Microbacterium sp.]